MEIDRALDSAQKISLVIDALKSGTLRVREQDEGFVRELLALPRGITGLIDITSLSPQAVSRARSMALAMTALQQERHELANSSTLGLQDAQCELFRLFEQLFVALTGEASEAVVSMAGIKGRMLHRIRHSHHDFVDDFKRRTDELEQFYSENAIQMFRAAKSLGGVKAVTGGQRTYETAALTATRIAGLYCDTQLLPDPVYPFLAGDLHLNAMPLQLAIALFYILRLRPLVDAQLPEPPVFIFPSFEESLEERDVVTQVGIASLLVKVVAPACNANLQTVEELFEYAQKHEHSFLDAIVRERLFVPPGEDPEDVCTAEKAASAYLRALKGVRSSIVLSQMEQLPLGILLLNGIFERLRPQYHLIENAEELAAQPILSQRVHWYYFERCARAEALELVNQRVLSRESLDILRALQDDSLTWLANIPVESLVAIRRNREHAALREQLKDFTTQLTSAGPADFEAVTREVRHGLEAMIQLQQKAIKDIEAKYTPKKGAAITAGALGVATGAFMLFMPAFAAASGVKLPEAGMIAGLGTGALGYARARTSQLIEQHQARRTLLGLLATARHVEN